MSRYVIRPDVAIALARDEAVIREYIRNQEKEDKRLDQLSLIK